MAGHKKKCPKALNGKFKLQNRTQYPLGIGLAALCVVFLCAVVPDLRNRDWVLGLVAVVLGIGYFLIQQHARDAQFFQMLFREFNLRYDNLNDELQKLIDHEQEFSQKERLKVIDYFNLCAEEWLYYEAGYIDEKVWRAWRDGMKFYGKDPRFAKLWAEERAGLNYYGFEFPPREASNHSLETN
jgi:hypothetical protein